ncbi:MAG: hypothetical protein OXH15_05285 [Gammaproteobacteria bacterium]|nr:hypothetical protein [Gammaproteobacteria bacterium]
MANLEMMVEFGARFVALPGAALTLVLLFLKLRRETPFVRTTEAQQLEAARLLRSGGDGPANLHPYEKGLLYRILAKSRFVSPREVELLLRLPDPYRYIDRLASVRALFEETEARCGPAFRFAGRYRSAGWRKAAKRVVSVAYFAMAFAACLPVLAIAVYQLLYVPEAVSPEQFAGIAIELWKLAAISLPVFGYLAFECVRWLSRMRRAEELLEAVAAFAAAEDAEAG